MLVSTHATKETNQSTQTDKHTQIQTCSNFMHSRLSQSSPGGNSGIKTKSASLASAATNGKYL